MPAVTGLTASRRMPTRITCTTNKHKGLIVVTETANRHPAEQPFVGMAEGESAMERLSRKLAHLVQSPEDASINIASRILDAETAEDILAPVEALNAEDLNGAPFTLNSVAILPSGMDGGIGFFAVFDASDPQTGDQMSITCGAANVVAQAAALYDKGFLPMTVVIEISRKATSRGFYPMSLRLWEPEKAF